MTTLEQIAQRAGVSRMTVSNILNGRNKELWPGAIRRAGMVRKLAEEMGYRPNAAARAIAQGRFHNIAMVLAQSAQFMPDGLLRGAAQALAKRDLGLSITELPDEKLTSAGYLPRVLRELSSDGLLINYIHSIPTAIEPLLNSNRIPSIWINVKMPRNCVHPDDYAASVEATRHLLEMGHRRIVMVASAAAPLHYSVADRIAGYEHIMREAGLSPRIVNAHGGRFRRGPDGLEQLQPDDRLPVLTTLLGEQPRPTAVLAAGVEHATATLLAAARCGIDVPTDLSILTFHDWLTNQSGPMVDFMHVSMTDVGHEAVRLLCERIQDPLADLPPVAIPFRLVEGQTLAPCRG